MVAIKDMEMPSCCAECVISRIDNARYMVCSTTSSICENPCFRRSNDCPLVEIEERKVGKWIGEKGYPICDKCGCNIYEKYISCSDYAEIIEEMDYCPNCGAEMRGSENEQNI